MSGPSNYREIRPGSPEPTYEAIENTLDWYNDNRTTLMRSRAYYDLMRQINGLPRDKRTQLYRTRVFEIWVWSKQCVQNEIDASMKPRTTVDRDRLARYLQGAYDDGLLPQGETVWSVLYKFDEARGLHTEKGKSGETAPSGTRTSTKRSGSSIRQPKAGKKSKKEEDGLYRGRR